MRCVHFVILLLCGGLLGACASPSPSAPQASVESGQADAPDTPASPSTDADKNLASAVTTPLTDLNLVRAPIPEILKKAQTGPYKLESTPTCASLSQEITELDAVLGADIDTPVTDKNPSLIERGAQAGGNMAVDSVRRTAEGIVPFRSWIRKLSGAERYARQVAASITAGSLRRSFLKGVRLANNCQLALDKPK